MRRRLQVPRVPGWLEAFLKSCFWRSRRGRLVTCLGGASPDTTLLSAGEVTTELQRGVSAQSVSATLDPTQLRNWDIKRGKLILLRVFNFASRKLMVWLPPWAMGKIWNEAKPLCQFLHCLGPKTAQSFVLQGTCSLTVKRKDLQWTLTVFIAARHGEFSAWKEIMTELRHLRKTKLSAGCSESYVNFPGYSTKGFSFCLLCPNISKALFNCWRSFTVFKTV